MRPLGVASIVGGLKAYPKTPQPAILSLSKGGWRLRKAAPFG
jgi:hypothetical protein